MDGGTISTNPESLAGILKTIFLFLENQNFTETCGTLIKESQSKQIPHIREALARLVVLRPSFAEIVRIAHADPKNPDTDSQVQADFPLSHSDKSCVLEGSVYAMPETHPSTKHVSLFITDSKKRANVEDGKIRTASAPNLQTSPCPKEDDVARRPPKDDSVEKVTEEAAHEVIEKPIEEAAHEVIEKPIEEAAHEVIEKPIEDDLKERAVEAEEPTEDEAVKPEEDSVCHPSCIGPCSDNESKDCVILKQAYDYVIIQQSCPDSCSGACSEEHLASYDTESDQGTDMVPIEVIHEPPGEISEAVTSLESTEDINAQLDQGKVATLSSEAQPSSKGSLSVDGYKRAGSDLPQSSGKSVESLPRSIENSDLRQSFTQTDEVSVDSRKLVTLEASKTCDRTSCPSQSTGKCKTSEEVLAASLSSREKGSLSSKGTVEAATTAAATPPSSYGRGTLGSKEAVEDILRTIEDRVFTESSGPVERHIPAKKRTSSPSVKELFRESTFKSPSTDEREDTVSYRSSQLTDEAGKKQVPLVERPSKFKEEPAKKETGGAVDLLCLDYAKLKEHLLEGDPEINRKLLRALRWRLTSAKQQARHMIMIEYSRNDVLGLHGRPNEESQSIAEELLCPAKESPNQLQEGVARFINAMASLTLGREYLCKNDHFLTGVLIPLLLQDDRKCSLSDVTRCHLLVTLQKLSLRNQMRKTMIFAGVPEYTVSFLLAKHNELSQYCLEYTAALFMNLCLHAEARDQLKRIPDKVIDLIIAFLDSNHDECLPYLNGAMYSAFIEPNIRTMAIDRKLDVKIQEKIRQGKSAEVRQQMEIIQNILNLDPLETYCTECDCLDQDEEVEHLEPELDADDLTDARSELVLEQFKKCEPCKVLGSYKLDCLRRPVTPLQKSSFSAACRSCCMAEALIEGAEEKRTKEKGKKKTSGPQTKKAKAEKTVDTLYKADKPSQQESKMDSELNYLLAAKQAIGARQPRTSRRSYSRPSNASKSMGRSEMTEAELNSIYFQRKHFIDAPCTRPCLNPQGRTRFRADQAKAYRPFSSCMTQTSQSSQIQNRYRCDCFEEMKTLISQLGTDSQQRRSSCRRNKPNLSSGLDAELEEPETPVIVQPSYNELLHSLRRNLCGTEYCTSEPNCTVHCECYNLVFQSRPKVTRTP